MDNSEKEYFEKTLNEGRMLDWTMVFLIGKRLLKSVKKWKAYELGLIDDKAKVIRKPKTPEEKDALTILDRFVLQLKRLVTPRNLILLTGFYLLKDSLSWDDITAKGDIELMEKCKTREKVQGVIKRFEKDIKENFENEDDFWQEFMYLKK